MQPAVAPSSGPTKPASFRGLKGHPSVVTGTEEEISKTSRQLKRKLNLKARTGVFRGAKPDKVTLEREERGNDKVFENRGTG
jgi:hypothetical protein